MAEGLTFGKVVKGAVLGTLAVSAVAVGFDDIADRLADFGNFDSITDETISNLAELDRSSPEAFLDAAKNASVDMDIAKRIPHEIITNGDNFTENNLLNAINNNSWTDKAASVADSMSEYAAKGIDHVENLFAEDNAKYGYETFQQWNGTDAITNGDGGIITPAQSGMYDVIKEASTAAWDSAKQLPADIASHKELVAGSAIVGGVGTYALTNRGKHTAAVNAERGRPSGIASVANGAGTVARRSAGLGADLIKTAGSTVGGVASGVNRAVRGA